MRGVQAKSFVVAAGGTGAAAGDAGAQASIGGATARRLAAEGGGVVVGDIDLTAAERTVELIEADGGEAVAHRFDAGEAGDIAGLVDRAVSEFGGLDGLHYNAMDMSRATLGVDSESDLLTLPLDVWQRSLDVGVTGFVLACRAAIPRLLERGGGAIVGTIASSAYVGEPIRLGYATSKLGMTAVTRHIASRWGRDGIRANTVAPGMVPGQQMLDNLGDDERARLRGIIRSDRLGESGDIAATVAFLLSDDGSWINAQSIAVDGGATMRP